MRAVKAKLVRRAVCACGHPTVKDEIPLGKIYTAYPETIQAGRPLFYCGGCGTVFSGQAIVVSDGVLPPGMLPLDLFELDEGVAA